MVALATGSAMFFRACAPLSRADSATPETPEAVEVAELRRPPEDAPPLDLPRLREAVVRDPLEEPPERVDARVGRDDPPERALEPERPEEPLERPDDDPALREAEPPDREPPRELGRAVERPLPPDFAVLERLAPLERLDEERAPEERELDPDPLA